MLKKLFKLFESSPSSTDENTTLETIPHEDHHINPRDISQGSLKVIQILQKAKFEAYLVGGGVRDLLLGEKPKDFDVATNATPEQVNKLFKSARIIGKRFKIVHVRFGREIIEVTTFRGSHTAGKKHKRDAVQAESGVLLRDNVYGDLQSDALRRDFTINALYYNPKTCDVIDFCGGVKDLKARTLRIIGDANDRYKEDPVRMIRAARFAAKLAFNIEPGTEQPLYEHAALLSQIPPARLFEEVLKLFANGYGLATFGLLREYKLFEHLFPATDHCFSHGSEFDRALIENSLVNTDKRIRQGKRITPAFIYAVFLWPPLQASIGDIMADSKISYQEAYTMATQGVISQQLTATSLPKRFMFPMKDIWLLQQKLPKRDRKRAFSTLEHQRFRAAYDFMLLREQAGEALDGLGEWWTTFQFATDEVKDTMLDAVAATDQSPKKRKPRRRKKKPGAQQKDPVNNTHDDNGATSANKPTDTDKN